jgi:Mg2+ and Co2+ transporter CorA
MAKQAQEKVGLIAQAEAEYEAIVDEVRGYCQKARELRQQADELRRSGNIAPKVASEVRKLLEQAEYFYQLADEKDGHPRLEAIRRLEELQREASGLRETVQHNESVLARQKKELDVAKEEAAAMIRRAEERIQETEQLIASQMAKLEELEG